MEKAYIPQLPKDALMAEHSLDALLKDQAVFVDRLFCDDRALLKYQKARPLDFARALRAETTAGIRQGIERFISDERRSGRDQGDNILDYDIARFLEYDLAAHVAMRLKESRAVREACVNEFKLGLFDGMIENIAYIAGEAYRARISQVYLGEVKPRASHSDKSKSSE